ncbi:hypothetical protein OH76DRAFT_1490311 [Lentinus brumalis]|uniref:Uncharacterized protein n=1 Tax=Lentinus brumalis TaxID=2498619 RepID=A0A371CJF8_9APHY|nr:hypothetical protein OH76DRAFT_1490311 [Polyporus brumalis]
MHVYLALAQQGSVSSLGYHVADPSAHTGVESPTVGNCNTICTRARVHHTLRISSYCFVGAGLLPKFNRLTPGPPTPRHTSALVLAQRARTVPIALAVDVPLPGRRSHAQEHILAIILEASHPSEPSRIAGHTELVLPAA